MAESAPIKPAFITFTGVDRATLIPGLEALSGRYPIEWGILIDPAQEEQALFPTAEERLQVQSSGLRLSAHICGEPARTIAAGENPGDLRLDGFSRLQINHSRDGSSDTHIDHCFQFANSLGMRAALQCQGAFPEEPRTDWLYDVSFGLGERPTTWPLLGMYDGPNSTLCGYSGGISPATVVATLAALPLTDADEGNFWIDMESGVRTDGWLDLNKCEVVCQLVYGS